MKVTKIFNFCAAHRLTNHDGLCRNVHGHSYKLEVTMWNDDLIEASEPSSEGMVFDFNKLKKLVEPIVALLDHSLIIWDSPDNKDPLDLSLKLLNTKTYLMKCRSTTENLCVEIYDKILNEMDSQHIFDCYLSKVKIWESESSWVEYEGEWSH